MSTTPTRTLDTQELEQRVKRMYEQVAREPDAEFHFETGRPLAERLGHGQRQRHLAAGTPPGHVQAIEGDATS